MAKLNVNLLPEILDCPECGSNLKLDEHERVERKFDCPACGKSIVVNAPPPAKRDTRKLHFDGIKCPKCGRISGRGVTKCNKCGSILHNEKMSRNQLSASAPKRPFWTEDERISRAIAHIAAGEYILANQLLSKPEQTSEKIADSSFLRGLSKYLSNDFEGAILDCWSSWHASFLNRFHSIACSFVIQAASHEQLERHEAALSYARRMTFYYRYFLHSSERVETFRVYVPCLQYCNSVAKAILENDFERLQTDMRFPLELLNRLVVS